MHLTSHILFLTTRSTLGLCSLLSPIFFIGFSPIAEGLEYRVDGFELAYGMEHPDLPPLSSFDNLHVKLGEAEEALSAPSEDLPSVQIALSDRWDDRVFTGGAIDVIAATIVEALNEEGVFGVFVLPDPGQIDPGDGRDLRPGQEGILTFRIWAGEVQQTRTVGKGRRFAPEEAINNRKHRRILGNSPLQPVDDERPRGSLLEKRELDDYLARLNRHPGRRIEAALSSAEEPGGMVLDYLVTEDRPWMAYAQVSNTGTDSTHKWRQRVGFVHHQLTDNDDILSLDFITARLDETNAAFGSYNFPLVYPDRLRLKTFGSWSEFTASDVGVANMVFEGESWTAGVEAIASPFRVSGFAFDVFAGGQWQDIEVTNETFGLEGSTNLLLAYTGLNLERRTELASTRFRMQFETNIPGTAGTDSNDLAPLGRLDADKDWYLVEASFNQSFFLEPLFFREDWRDPENWRTSALAHEIVLRGRGQYVFNDRRLIPQKQQVAGGFFSVRGYPESVAAGDNVIMGTAEYRFHIPRALRPYSVPGDTDNADEGTDPRGGTMEPPSLFGRSFHVRPPRPYTRPDWNLIARGFFDAGYVEQNKIRPEEENRTLLGAGVGLELQVRRHLNIRSDLGFALRDIESSSENVDRGDTRIHFMATLSW